MVAKRVGRPSNKLVFDKELEFEDSNIESTKTRMLEDLEFFIRTIHPHRVLSACHSELIKWWTRPEAKTHQLALLPRDHQKSALIAYRVVWELTRNPALRILYISSTSNLAEKQLKFIKDILTSPKYMTYFPDMVNKDEAKREKWRETEISVDHPLRREESVRDPSVFTAGLTTNIVGLHCDIAVLDDVVVDSSAYDESGRAKLRDQVSYLASIGGTDSKTWVVGTRYHPLDLYNDMLNQVVEIYDEIGNRESAEHLYEIYERQVEDRGDGTGEYLWPRTQREDGKWFGFNQQILARKRAQYTDPSKFRAQYYNDPNDLSESSINRDMFQYYDRKNLQKNSGRWFYKTEKLNIFASIDFAFSVNKNADCTAIVVIGVDRKNNYYVLDIERFKTKKISDYYDAIFKLFTRWDFRKIRAETTVAQSMIVEDLKNNYIRPNGLALVIDEHRPTRKKEDRIEAALQPKYANKQIFHYEGGLTSMLEEELVLRHPSHDDIKDALASAIEIAVAPSFMGMGQPTNKNYNTDKIFYHPRFGGIG